MEWKWRIVVKQKISVKCLLVGQTEFNLLGSVGSDFHFPCGWIELGKNLDLVDSVIPVWEKF